MKIGEGKRKGIRKLIKKKEDYILLLSSRLSLGTKMRGYFWLPGKNRVLSIFVKMGKVKRIVVPSLLHIQV